jgi:hypothetical protein
VSVIETEKQSRDYSTKVYSTSLRKGVFLCQRNTALYVPENVST